MHTHGWYKTLQWSLIIYGEVKNNWNLTSLTQWKKEILKN
jgi:hypothetical protein